MRDGVKAMDDFRPSPSPRHALRETGSDRKPVLEEAAAERVSEPL